MEQNLHWCFSNVEIVMKQATKFNKILLLKIYIYIYIFLAKYTLPGTGEHL